MELSSISATAAIAGQSSGDLQGTFATVMLRKQLDMESSQAAQLIQLVSQSAGLGTAIDTHA